MGSKWAALGMLPASPHIRAGPSSHRFYTSHLSLMGTVLFFLFPEKTVCRGRWLWLVASVWPGTPLSSASLLGDAPAGRTRETWATRDGGVFFSPPVSTEQTGSQRRGWEKGH